MKNIGLKTKIVGLLGNPLEHSKSQPMQNAAFENENLDYFYLPIEVIKEDLGDVVKGISKMNFGGFNVTVPHKIEVMKYLDEIDEMASIIGSVNTVLVKDKKLIGYNTDGEGFVSSLEKETGVNCEGKTILLIGSGGACRAIAATLAYRGVEKIILTNRTKSKAEDLSNDINSKARQCCEVVDNNYDSLKEIINTCDIIINTTSVGMYPKIDASPIDTSLITKKHIVGDVTYNPDKTKLLLEAEDKGCIIVNGKGMLVNQGAKAFEIWTGVKAPVKIMENAIISK